GLGVEVNRLRLRDDEAVRPQRTLAQRVELVLEQPSGGPDRIGEIDHDHIEVAREFGDRIERIAGTNIDARIGERITGDRVVLTRDLDNLLVELEEVHPLDARMLQHLGNEMYVAAADDCNRAWI